MTHLKIGAQLHTVRDYCLTREGLFDALRRIRDMGYDGVEIENVYKVAPAEEIADFLKEIGLSVCCTRSKNGRTLFDLDGMIREAKLYGTAYMGVGTAGCDNSIYGGPQAAENFSALLTTVAEKAAENGLIAEYDLHSHEFLRDEENGLSYLRAPDLPFFAQKLLALTPEASLHMVPDTWHVRLASLTVPEVLSMLKGRCDILRFRDAKATLNELDFYRAHLDPCECGEGLGDLGSWLPALEDAGIKWLTLGQEFCTKDPFTCLDISLKNVRRILG